MLAGFALFWMLRGPVVGTITQTSSLAAWAGLVACVALLKPLGFIASFALFTLFLVRFLYGQSFGRALAIAVGGSLGFYLLFDKALNVSLPAGILGF